MRQLRRILTVPNLAVALLAVLSLSARAQEGADTGELAELRERGRAYEALAEAREFLRSEPAPDMSDRTRIMICKLRRSLPGGAPPPREASAALESGNGPERLESGSGAEESSPLHVLIGGDIQRPEKISSPPPQYTQTARKKNVQGTVNVQAIIDREGCVVNIKVLKGLEEGMSAQAVKAIRTWVYRPAELLGEPVDVYYNLTVNFRLQRKKRP